MVSMKNCWLKAFKPDQSSPQEIKVEWYGILIFINIDHESH